MPIEINGTAGTREVPDLGRLPEVTAALAARAGEHDRAGSFPADGIATVHAAGLLTATVSERYGGAGAGLAQTVAIVHELVVVHGGTITVGDAHPGATFVVRLPLAT